MKDEKSFHPSFLKSCSDMQLVGLQHDLRKFPEDKPYLDQVLEELKRRAELRRNDEGTCEDVNRS